MKRIIFVSLIASAGSAFGQFVGGIGFANINEDLKEFGDINVGIAYASVAYEFSADSLPSFTFVPEVRYGTGVFEDTVRVRSEEVELSAKQFLSIAFRVEYQVSEDFYIYTNPAYTYLEAEAAVDGETASDSGWELGVGLGAGYNLSETAAIEVSTEFYEDTLVIGGSFRFRF